VQHAELVLFEGVGRTAFAACYVAGSRHVLWLR